MQVEVHAEAVSNKWNFNAYVLVTIREVEQKINWFYTTDALDTYGLDVGYFITPELNASVSYYYRSVDSSKADASGLLARLAYEVTSGVTAGVNLSYV